MGQVPTALALNHLVMQAKWKGWPHERVTTLVFAPSAVVKPS
jgi:hypothetical protein